MKKNIKKYLTNLIKNINNHLQDNNDDFVVFFENSTASVLSPNFSLMSVNEIWSFEGSLIATNVSTAISMRKCFAPKNKLFYRVLRPAQKSLVLLWFHAHN